MTKKVDYYKQ